jgi:hypothetical protein
VEKGFPQFPHGFPQLLCQHKTSKKVRKTVGFTIIAGEITIFWFSGGMGIVSPVSRGFPHFSTGPLFPTTLAAGECAAASERTANRRSFRKNRINGLT